MAAGAGIDSSSGRRPNRPAGLSNPYGGAVDDLDTDGGGGRSAQLTRLLVVGGMGAGLTFAGVFLGAGTPAALADTASVGAPQDAGAVPGAGVAPNGVTATHPLVASSRPAPVMTPVVRDAIDDRPDKDVHQTYLRGSYLGLDGVVDDPAAAAQTKRVDATGEVVGLIRGRGVKDQGMGKSLIGHGVAGRANAGYLAPKKAPLLQPKGAPVFDVSDGIPDAVIDGAGAVGSLTATGAAPRATTSPTAIKPLDLPTATAGRTAPQVGMSPTAPDASTIRPGSHLDPGILVADTRNGAAPVSGADAAAKQAILGSETAPFRGTMDNGRPGSVTRVRKADGSAVVYVEPATRFNADGTSTLEYPNVAGTIEHIETGGSPQVIIRQAPGQRQTPSLDHHQVTVPPVVEHDWRQHPEGNTTDPGRSGNLLNRVDPADGQLEAVAGRTAAPAGQRLHLGDPGTLVASAGPLDGLLAPSQKPVAFSVPAPRVRARPTSPPSSSATSPLALKPGISPTAPGGSTIRPGSPLDLGTLVTDSRNGAASLPVSGANAAAKQAIRDYERVPFTGTMDNSRPGTVTRVRKVDGSAMVQMEAARRINDDGSITYEYPNVAGTVEYMDDSGQVIIHQVPGQRQTANLDHHRWTVPAVGERDYSHHPEGNSVDHSSTLTP